jgi:hypothetical protein
MALASYRLALFAPRMVWLILVSCEVRGWMLSIRWLMTGD